MQPPVCRLTTENLDEALRQMRGHKHDYGFVFEDEQYTDYKGFVTRELIENEIDQPGKNADLSDLAEEVFSVQPDASLEEILPASLEHPYPVPVVDEEGEFRGVVSRKSMISILSENDENGAG